MPHARSSHQRAPRSFVPLIVGLGPLLCTAALSALGYMLFRAQAATSFVGRGSIAGLSGPLEYTIVLALAGALVSLLAAMLGLALYGRSQKSARAAERALAEAAVGAEAIAAVARRVAEHGARRDTVADGWARRQRDAVALLAALDGRRAALQRVTGDIWAGLSHPGAPLDPAMALRLARESAVAGAALGSHLDELRALLAASRTEAGAIEAIDDALIEDLITVQRLAKETYATLQGSVANSSGGKLVGSRAQVSSYRVAPATAVQSVVDPGMRTGELPRADTRQGQAIPRQPYGVERAPNVEAGPAWPPPPGPGAPHEQEGSSSSVRPAAPPERWPFRPEDARRAQAKEDSSVRPREPRNRDESSSRWLND
jgi:hypothetical protein